MPTIKKLKYHTVKEKNIKDYSLLYNHRWEKLRNAYISEHPLCELCLEKGIIREAKEVHHIKPISYGKDELEMRELAYNYNNLMALCIECHHKIHQKLKDKN